jgi:hypothetical protein
MDREYIIEKTSFLENGRGGGGTLSITYHSQKSSILGKIIDTFILHFSLDKLRGLGYN